MRWHSLEKLCELSSRYLHLPLGISPKHFVSALKRVLCIDAHVILCEQYPVASIMYSIIERVYLDVNICIYITNISVHTESLC